MQPAMIRDKSHGQNESHFDSWNFRSKSLGFHWWRSCVCISGLDCICRSSNYFIILWKTTMHWQQCLFWTPHCFISTIWFYNKHTGGPLKKRTHEKMRQKGCCNTDKNFIGTAFRLIFIKGVGKERKLRSTNCWRTKHISRPVREAFLSSSSRLFLELM